MLKETIGERRSRLVDEPIDTPFDLPVRTEVVHLDDDEEERSRVVPEGGTEDGEAQRKKAMEDKARGKRPVEETTGTVPPTSAHAAPGGQPPRVLPNKSRILTLLDGSNYMDCHKGDLIRLFPLLGVREIEFIKGRDTLDLLGAMASSTVQVFLWLKKKEFSISRNF